MERLVTSILEIGWDFARMAVAKSPTWLTQFLKSTAMKFRFE